MTQSDVRTRREALLLTQPQLAHLAGISDETLRKIEQGKKVGPTSLRRVLDALAAAEAAEAPQPPTVSRVVEGRVVVEPADAATVDLAERTKAWVEMGRALMDEIERAAEGNGRKD